MTCPNIPEIDLGEWSDRILEQLHGQRYPLRGSLELTGRCNFNCVHCYINQPASNLASRKKELTIDQIRGLIDQMVDAGCLFLTITGGEPLLRPDFPEIYHYAIHKGLLIKLFTNGTLLSESIVALLAEFPPRSVEISLYGATGDTYEKVTRRKHAYGQVHQGIQRLIEKGIPFSLKTMVLTLNQHEFDQIRSYAEQINVNFRYDNLIWPRLDGDLTPLSYQLPPEDLVQFDFADPKRQQEWIRLYERLEGEKIRASYVYSCGAGVRSFHINWQGQLSACMMLQDPSYDLMTMTFQEAWERIGALRQKKRIHQTACQSCMLNDLCDQCPAWAKIVHHDEEKPVELLCQIAHMRAAEIDKIKISDKILSEEIISYE